MAERLYIVDGHGYIFRAHYGLMNVSRGERKEVRLSTSEGMPTGALYVFSRMLMRLEEDNAPEADGGRVRRQERASRRSAPRCIADYKATPQGAARRAPGPDGVLREDRDGPRLAVHRGARRRGRRRDRDAGRRRRSEKGWEVVIYCADKDIMQMIGDGVTMIDALHQKTYTREEVIKKMGVPPEQIPDFLALVGDTSDNIPGI